MNSYIKPQLSVKKYQIDNISICGASGSNPGSPPSIDHNEPQAPTDNGTGW